MADDSEYENLYETPQEAEPAQSGDDEAAPEQDKDETVKRELANIDAFPDAAPGKRYEVVIDAVHEKEVEFHVENEMDSGEEHSGPSTAHEMAGGMGGEDDNDMMS